LSASRRGLVLEADDVLPRGVQLYQDPLAVDGDVQRGVAVLARAESPPLLRHRHGGAQARNEPDDHATA
jgi:hypothetical protein